MATGDPKFWTDDIGRIHAVMVTSDPLESTAEGALKAFKTIVENFNPGYTEIENNYIENWDEIFMRAVYNIAKKSKDPKTKIGAILVKDKIPVIQCFNGFPRKIKDLPERYNNRELKRRMVAHAEGNTVKVSARLGKSTDKTICYTQGIPCSGCAIDLIQGGIIEIVIHKQWPNLTHSPEWVSSIELSKMMLEEAGINIRVFDKVLNLHGYLDGKIINV